MTPSDAIRQAVLKDGRTLRDIADAAGLNIGQMSRFTRGLRGLNTHSVDRLCEALGVEVRLVRRRAKRRKAKA